MSIILAGSQMHGIVPFKPVKNWKEVSTAHDDRVLSSGDSLRMAISVRAFSPEEPTYDQSARRNTIIL